MYKHLILTAIVVVSSVVLFTGKPVAAQEASCNETVQFLAPPPDDSSWWAQYQADITGQVTSIRSFWAATFPQTWTNDPCTIEYVADSVPYQDVCGITPETAASNAFYCSTAHVVMWDGPTFFQPIYQELGDKAVLFIIAHEYGHAAQFTSGQIPARSVNLELQADCYAGAYLQYAEAQGLMSEGDAREVIAIVAAVGQSRVGSTWFTRTHGTAAQREAALLRGYRTGVTGCQVDFEALIEEGVERPIENLPAGETTITLPDGGEVVVTVPESGDQITVTGPQGNTVTLPVPHRPKQ